MKTILKLAFTLFLFHSSAAQNKSIPAATKTPVDTFSRNIITAIKKVTAAVVNPKYSGIQLTKDLLGTNGDQQILYTSLFNLWGSEKTYVQKTGTDRSRGITKWEWVAVIATAPKLTMTTLLQTAKNRLDSIVKTIVKPTETDPKHHIEAILVSDYFNKDYLKKDSLSLSVIYTKPVSNTEKEAIDSIAKIYRPMFAETNSVVYASNALGRALKTEGIAKPLIQDEYTQIIRMVASRNINDAWKVLMNCPEEVVDYAKLKDSLPPDQRQQITAMATKMIKDLNDWQNQKNQPPVPTPVKVEEPASFTERWCQEDIAKAKYKAGTFFHSKKPGIMYGFIVSFKCLKGYFFATVTSVPPRKTFFKTNDNVGYNRIDYEWVPENYIDNSFTPKKEKYLLCGTCHGSGVIYKTQTRTKGGSWEQVNFNVYIHSPSRITAEWEEREVCPQCLGAGLKEVK